MSDTRILLVEDEAVVAMDIEEGLKRLGYKIAGSFSRGEDAVEAVASLKPDLVLMDITLAGEMDGIRTATLIRQRHNIPVVYLTAHSDENTLTRALDALPHGYLVKPFSEVDLHTTIEVSLKKHESDQQSREMAQWFGRATSIIGGAIILTDAHGVVQHLNSLAEVMTGWDKTEATGRPITEILVLKHQDTEPVAERHLLSDSEGDLVVPSAACVLVGRDTSETAIEIAVLPMGDSDERLRHVIFSFQERTEQSSRSQDWVSVTANLLINAELSCSEGDSHQAVSFYERALAVLESHVERDSPRLALVLEDLAKAYRQAGRSEDARMFAIRSARIRSHRHSNGQMHGNRSSGYQSAHA